VFSVSQPTHHDVVVNLTVRDSAVASVVRAIAHQAHLKIIYDNTNPLFEKRVSVHIVHAPVMDAFAEALRGTGLIATLASDNETVVIRSAPQAKHEEPADSGTIRGQVTDSASGAGIAGATVMVQGTKLSAITSAHGQFMLNGVPVGKYIVHIRMLGYASQTRQVVIEDGKRVSLNIVMAPSTTVLSGVVTTATGTQRKIEVGNDITTINVDSVMRVAPINSVTDLLETRVPGLTVLHSSGTPGDPSRIRLRGASSITGNNDPIVIVDGARVYAAQSDARNSSLAPTSIGGTNTSTTNRNTGRYATPSPLDQIDPNTIATIEVFKGPSATALYGSDAANGVIVITTKHGQANKTHWSVSLGQGVNWVPGAWPVNYYRFGSNTITTYIPGESALESGMCLWSDTECHVDSIVDFQALNDPRYTVFSHGSAQNTSITVSGGVPSLLYSFTGSAQRTTGNLKLPELEQQRYEKFYGPIPNDLVHPDRYTTIGGSGNLTAQPIAALSIQWNSSLFQGDQQRSSLETAVGQLQQAYIDPTQLASGSLIEGEYERATDHQVSSTNSVTLQWQARPWFLLRGTGGLNTIQRTDETYLPYGVNSASPTDPFGDTTGAYGLGKGTSQVVTAALGASFPARFVNTAVGLNYTATSTADMSAQTSQLSPGVSRPNSFPTTAIPGYGVPSSFTQSTSAASTYGWYVQPTLHLNSRFFANPGFRLDGGSASGSQAGLTGFPKLDFSYVAVDQDNPIGIITLFHPRLAFGYAGTQPSPVDKLRLFNAGSGNLVSLDGGATQVPSVQLTSLGNTHLRPERTSEIEGGFDASLGDDRIRFSLTFHNKTRHDAIIPIPVAPSVSGIQTTIQKNIGVVRNAGTEVLLTARLLDTRTVSWMVTTNMSQEKNKVIRLNPDESTIIVGHTRVEAGYPLWGAWAQPILSYFDANHNGVIEYNEVRLGDSAVFVGQSDPKYQLNASSTLRLLNGQLSVTANVSYQRGLTQTQGTVGPTNTMLLNLPNVPGATFATQAAVVASALGSDGRFNFVSGGQSDIGLIQTVNMFRFNSLSVNYRPPLRVAQWLHAPNMSIALQGSNLGLHTNYRGIDPNVNAFSTASRGDILRDTGELPLQRTWTLSVRLGN
jgi:TonB-linked SusC/RagA family outer membrane protein